MVALIVFGPQRTITFEASLTSIKSHVRSNLSYCLRLNPSVGTILRRLQRDTCPEPPLATARTLPQWANHVNGGLSGPGNSVLYLSPRWRRRRCGFSLHSSDLWEFVLDNGLECNSLPRQQGHGSGVRRGIPAILAFCGLVGTYMDWVVVGDGQLGWKGCEVTLFQLRLDGLVF